MTKKNAFVRKAGIIIIVMVLLAGVAEAYVEFMPKEQLVGVAEYIVVARVQIVSNTGKTMRWGEVTAKVVKNELQVIELIKGSLPLKKLFILNTFKFDGWMEDNVELPPKDSKVLLFLEKNKNGELKPVNGIQGVWPMRGGEPMGAGQGTMLEQIREMVQNQQDACTSRAFTSLLDSAEMQTQSSY